MSLGKRDDLLGIGNRSRPNVMRARKLCTSARFFERPMIRQLLGLIRGASLERQQSSEGVTMMKAFRLFLILAGACAPQTNANGKVEVTMGGGDRTLKRGQSVTWQKDTVAVRNNAGDLVSGVTVKIRCEVVDVAASPKLMAGMSCAASPDAVTSPSAETTVTIASDPTTRTGTGIAFVRLNYESSDKAYGGIEVAGIELSITE
jgi:hypothetical protein